jgi:hypothetical protein
MLGARGALTTRDIDMCLRNVDGLDFYECAQSEPNAIEVTAIPSHAASIDPRAIEDSLAPLGFRRVTTRVAHRLDPEPSFKFRLTGSRVAPLDAFA